MITFQIQNPNGTLSSVSHKEFFEALNDGSGYLYYKRGGKHLAMLPTATNEETIRVCRQADNYENAPFASDSRCRDEKGRLCRYQHDEYGSVIRNENGNPVCAKCGNCPRDGWTAGDRRNCCIRNVCKIEDCSCCTKHREYHVPISLDWLTEDKHDNNETDGAGFNLADPNVDIQALLENNVLLSALHIAIERLPFDEKAVIKAIFWSRLSQRAYAIEADMSRSGVKRLYDKALESLKNILKDFC